MHKLLLSFASATSAVFLLLTLGCASGSVPLGSTRDEVISRLGKPSAEVALASGKRLQYSQQPAGQQALMVDLDAANRVVSARQVLNPEGFARVVLGKWTRQDIEREFGRPATIDRVASWPGDVMAYRWLDVLQGMYFWVYLDSAGVVQRIGQGMEIPMEVSPD